MTRISSLLLLVMLVSACSNDTAPLVATDIVVSKPIPGMSMAAGYLTLSNNTTQQITITEVTSPQFDSVLMHESVLEDGMARMYELGDLTILAGQSVRFEPGGKHLMLMQPVGEFETVTLEFRVGKVVMLTVNVALSN
jgi:copper(I)-binding protein